MMCIQCVTAPAEHLSQFCAGCAREHRQAIEYDRRAFAMEYDLPGVTDEKRIDIARPDMTYAEKRQLAAENYHIRIRAEREDVERWRAFDERRKRASPPG